MSAFTTGRSASVAATADACSFATRGASRDGDGSGAPSAGRPSRARLALLLCAAVALAAASLAPAASAAPKSVHSFLPTINPVSPTGLALNTGGAFNTSRGVAVNSTGAGSADSGDVYVADSGIHRVQAFDSNGNFKFAIGRDVIKPGGTGNLPNNEVQTITVNGATGGKFYLCLLTCSLDKTGLIPYDATAAQVQAAIVDKSTVKPGEISVSGPAGGPWAVEFIGARADSDINPYVVNLGPGSYPGTGEAYGLTPPGSTVTVAITTEGAKSTEVCTVANECKAGVSGTQGGMFNTPQGIAIDQSTGEFYVSEQGNLRVSKFSADGTFLRAWGKDVSVSDLSGAGEICTVAIDCKTGVTGGTSAARGGEFTSTFSGYLAVAPPGAPNAGNVVVADPANRRVQEFTSNGAFVRAWGFDVVVGGVTTFEICTVAAECKTAAASGSGVGQFSNNQPTRVAVDSTGATYAVEQGNPNFRVQKFDAALTPSIFAAGTLSGGAFNNTPTDVAIIGGDKVLVVKALAAGTGTPPATVSERRVLELDSAGTLLETHIALGRLNEVASLGANTGSGTIYASGSTSRLYIIDSVTPASGSLGVSAVTPHTAQLTGAVNPNGPNTTFGVTTSYRVEYSEDGVTWTTLGTEVNAGKGTVGVGFSKNLTGLKADTLYQARIVINKQFNPPVLITGTNFVTTASRPDVQALSPTNRGDTSATLNARINPNGQATSYHFEYGTTLSYGTTVPIPDGAAGAGKVPVVVAEPIAGLSPNTTYHFRVIATNASGTSTSEDRTFTTAPTGPQPPDGRAYEMVSPAEKIGGVGFGYWGTTGGYIAASGTAAYTGERFAAGANYGSPIDGDSKHGFTNDWALADRVNDQLGWRSHTPLTHPNYYPTLAQYTNLTAASPDLSRLYIDGGNATPAIFPEMGSEVGWLRVSTGFFLDWGSDLQPSRWELFGPQSLGQIGPSPIGASLWSHEFSLDGTALVGHTTLDGSTTPNKAAVSGLAGPGDPTWPAFGDLVAGRSIYLADTSGAPADTFAGTGTRELVNTCSGEVGVDRTELPTVGGNGLLGSAECPAPAPGRDSRLISERGAALTPTRQDRATEGIIDADGSRIFFMSPDPSDGLGVPDTACTGTGSSTLCPPQLYVRQENPDGSVATRWISKAEPALFGVQSASLTAGVRFEWATPDGSRVFFRANAPLTVDDPNGLDAPLPGGVKTGTPSPISSDLYMYEFPSDPNVDIGEGTLTRISAGPTGTGDCNSPLPADASGSTNNAAAALRFASNDGKRLYFTCSAPLPGVADAASGSITSVGGTPSTADQTNLYLYDEHKPAAERWRFVTRLPRSTGDTLVSCASIGLWRQGILNGAIGSASSEFEVGASSASCVNGTADGSFITFLTSGRLTADDPVGPATGDIYSYDADVDELTRITATQGGTGGSYLCGPGKGTNTQLCHGDNGADRNTNNSGIGRTTTPMLGVVTDPATPGERIAFFQSKVSLVPEDEDTGYDVYQWRNGELSLISPGAPNSTHAVYKGNSRDGRNVYFATRDALTWQDTDAVNDIYTARVGGGIVEPLTVACDILVGACEGARQAPPATPGQAASTVFAGQGNVVEKGTGPAKCTKGKVRKRGKCVKKGKKGSAKQRANTNGRAGR